MPDSLQSARAIFDKLLERYAIEMRQEADQLLAPRFLAHLALHDFGFGDFDVAQALNGRRRGDPLDALGVSVHGRPATTAEEVEAALAASPGAARIEMVALCSTFEEVWTPELVEMQAVELAEFFKPKDAKHPTRRGADWAETLTHMRGLLHNGADATGPSLRVRLAQLADADPDEALMAALEAACWRVADASKFQPVEFELLDATAIRALDQQRRRADQSDLRMGGMLPLPPSAQISRAWIGWTRATDLMAVVETPNGDIRPNVFFENVRGYLGSDGKANPVNAEMAHSLRGPEHADFLFRNNGVAIIAREVEALADNALRLTGPQIINGCQTTHTLFENRDKLTEQVAVPVKVIETNDRSVVRAITVATNCQTPVGEAEFLSQTPFVRQLQNYFNGRRLDDNDAQLWLERKTGELAEQRRWTPNRVMSAVDLIETYIAAFEERPHAAHDRGWRTALPRIDREEVLGPQDNPEIYYACGLIRWRVAEFAQKYAKDRRRQLHRGSLDRRRGARYPAGHQLALALRKHAAPMMRKIGRPSFRGGRFDAQLGDLIKVLSNDVSAMPIITAADETVRAAAAEIVRTGVAPAVVMRKKAMTDHILNQ